MKFKYVLFLSVVSTILVLDQLTKYLVMRKFALHESLPIIEGFFSLTYVTNKGAAFGFLADADHGFRTPFFLIVPLVALGVITYVFRKLPDTSRWVALALSLVLGGAVGNLIDRIRYGHVVDFLDFYWRFTSREVHFPAFNVADSAICVGVGILMLDLFLNGEKVEEKKNATRPI